MSTLKRYNGSTWENLSRNIIPLEDNGTTTAGTWLAKNSSVTSLVDGDLFLYKVTVAGASTTTLKINGLGAKTVYRYGTTKLTTQYGVGQYILLIYNSLNTSFRVVNDYDNDTNTKVRQYQAGTATRTGTQYAILARYALTDKAGSYDANYSRYHTDTYIDTSNGYLYAPKLYSGGNEVATTSDIPSAITSVDGLSGGTISSAVTVSGNITGQYLQGTWLKTTAATDLSSWTDVFVNDGNGWLYKRSKASFISDLGIPTVSVSDTGTATDEVGYITINGTEKKLAGGSSITFVDWS